VGVLHFYQALLRECFFHAHFVTVTVPASRLPLEPRQSSPSSVRVWLMARQSLPGMRLFGRPATKFAQHGAFSGSFALTPTPGRAGRTFSRTGSCDVATLKPMTPLQPLMQTNVKPPSPMLAPEQRPSKPPSPLQPKNALKTAESGG